MMKLGAARKAEATADDLAWAERCVYWQPEPAKPSTRRSRNPARSPLILTGHGIRLRVDHGSLVIRDGFTHYPQAVSEHRFFPGSPELPLRIIVIDGSGSLSFDVMTWLSEQQIPLIRVDWKGNVVALIGGASSPIRIGSPHRSRRSGPGRLSGLPQH
jgi:CRISPR-associated protein Cas1